MSRPAPQGYASPAYASAVSSGASVVPLGATGGHVTQRPIAGSDRVDWAGPYPLFDCADWGGLAQAVAGPLPGDPVSLTLVTDPFCPLAPAALAQTFDICRVLHDHWLIDLTQPLTPSRHHRRKLRQAGRAEIQAGPATPDEMPHQTPDQSADFARLYAALVAKKEITDLRAFSAQSLSAQLAVPGAHLVTAWAEGVMIGADLYYLSRGVAYAHLSAYAPEGYAQSVSYPMIAAAAEYFRPLAQVIDLGGVPAVAAGQKGGGVGHFKRGWTDLNRPSYLCGKICDREAYGALTRELPSDQTQTGYFPAYRARDFQR